MKKIAIPLCLLLSGQASATRWFVSTTGSNANTGQSVAEPFATLQFAADILLAGDSVFVSDGSYSGFNLMDKHGSAAATTHFSTTGPNVVITTPCTYNNLDGINVENCEWVVIFGFTVSGMPRTGIRSALSDHVTIAYNTCTDNGVWGILTGFAEHCTIEHNTCSGSIDQHGIYFSNSADDPVIRYNHCFDNHDNGIHMNGDISLGGDGTISNAQVYGNIIHDNGTGGGSGINCDGVINSVFYDNLLYGNHASGISLYQIDGGVPSTGNKVFNNTIINASDARWCVNITELCTGNQVLNNILINQHPWRGSIVIAADAQTGFVCDHNLVVNSLSPDGDATLLTLVQWQALGYDANSPVADAQSALFVDPLNGDFHPLSPSAQMVNAGSSAVASVVAFDLDGVLRPQSGAFDIGCYEQPSGTGVGASTSTGEAMRILDDGSLLMNVGASAILRGFDQTGALRLEATVSGEERVQLRSKGVWILVLSAPDGSPLSATTVVVR